MISPNQSIILSTCLFLFFLFFFSSSSSLPLLISTNAHCAASELAAFHHPSPAHVSFYARFWQKKRVHMYSVISCEQTSARQKQIDAPIFTTMSSPHIAHAVATPGTDSWSTHTPQHWFTQQLPVCVCGRTPRVRFALSRLSDKQRVALHSFVAQHTGTVVETAVTSGTSMTSITMDWGPAQQRAWTEVVTHHQLYWSGRSHVETCTSRCRLRWAAVFTVRELPKWAFRVLSGNATTEDLP